MKFWSASFKVSRLCAAIIVISLRLAWPAQAGISFTTIHSFSALAPNGSSPETPLTLGNDGNLYGVASGGGAYGSGTFFTMTPAGVVTVLYTFTGGIDGANPRGALQQGTNGNFYGATQSGGSNDEGAIFMITPQGDLTPLHAFSGQADGANPLAGLVLATDGNFYGTTAGGGLHDMGTVFQMTPTGGFTSLYSFKGETDGAAPLGPLAQGADGQLYGTASGGGDTSLNEGYGYGAIFKITTSGGITPLYAFTDASDGETPYSGLVQGMDGNFYGTAIHGTAGYGCVYQVTPSGGFNVLHDFAGEDGSGPTGTLIQGADTNLYGTTLGGGTNHAGAIFAITTNGGFTSLYSFADTGTGMSPSEGPYAGLVQGTNGNLYGVTLGGGNGFGTIFTMTTNEVLTNLYSFPGGGGDGASPLAALFVDTSGLLYGTTENGGTNGDGAVFQITANGILSPVYSFTNWTDGANPSCTLVADTNGNLWGTTGNYSPLLKTGGAAYGTVFELTTNGSLTTEYAFKDRGDGSSPHAGVIRGLDGNFYGTSYLGGSGYGTIFSISPAGLFTNLHSFNGTTDGGYPSAALIQATDTNFYGTTTSGTIYKLTPGGAFSVIYTFGSGSINGALTQGADGNLYGTSTSGNGTVFKITLPNTFSNLYSFTNGIDGATPMAGLVQASDGNFYGTTSAGGLNGNGSIFRIIATGNFQALYSFSATDAEGFNMDGANPVASLVQAADGNLYGVAEYGGQSGTGTIFKLAITPTALPPQFLSATESAGTLNFSWSAEAGSQYQLQYTTNLAHTNWLSLGAVLSATGSTLTGSDVSPSDAQRFYRVQLLP